MASGTLERPWGCLLRFIGGFGGNVSWAKRLNTDDTDGTDLTRLEARARRRKMECMRYLIAVLAVAGIVVSSLALHVHYMDPSAAPPCAVTEKFDCGAVNHGKYSVFPPLTDDDFDESGQPRPNKLHVPVALIGIAGYALIG